MSRTDWPFRSLAVGTHMVGLRCERCGWRAIVPVGVAYPSLLRVAGSAHLQYCSGLPAETVAVIAWVAQAACSFSLLCQCIAEL